jgi:hypothetical protein
LLVVTAAAGLATVPSLRSIRRLTQVPATPAVEERAVVELEGVLEAP